MKVVGVYAIKNTATGRKYIGSSVDVQKRIRTHMRHLRNGTHHSVRLQRSWDKHGPECFEPEMLESCTAVELTAREQHWIDVTDSCRNGYNMNPVANSVGSMPKSAEHKAKIGEARRGKKHSEISKLLIRVKAIGRAGHSKTAEQIERTASKLRGLKRTQEQRAAMSLAFQGRTPGPCSETRRAAISAAKTGKPMSDFQKQRIREGLAARRLREQEHAT